jgi:hypothetical protein
VAIRASSSKQTDALIADLSATSSVTRETAVARLTLLGARAVDRLLTVAGASASAEARTAAWRALEAIGDNRALAPALDALAAPATDPGVAAAAAGVARVHLRGADGARVVDRLTSVLLDRARPDAARLAALRALRDLDASTIAPLLASLTQDPSAAIRTEAGLSGRAAPRAPEDPAAEIARAAGGTLPDDPAALRHAVNLAGATAPVAALHKVIDRVREHEGSETAASRDQWRLTRAAAHVALAHRGSRIALYDLRESLEGSKGPLPVEFLAALALIGDASCIEAIASAHAKAKDSWWRHHLADAFYAIVQKEKLTSRHAAMKKAAKRSPALATSKT